MRPATSPQAATGQAVRALQQHRLHSKHVVEAIFHIILLVLQVFTLTRKAAEDALGSPPAQLLARGPAREMKRMRTRDNLGVSSSGQPRVEYEDLNLGRIIGAGQFGMVRIAQNKHNGDVYALKVGLLKRLKASAAHPSSLWAVCHGVWCQIKK